MLNRKIIGARALALLAVAVLAPALAGARGVLEGEPQEWTRRGVDLYMGDVLDPKRNGQEKKRLGSEPRVLNTSICPRETAIEDSRGQRNKTSTPSLVQDPDRRQPNILRRVGQRVIRVSIISLLIGIICQLSLDIVESVFNCLFLPPEPLRLTR
ncbi:MAG: hypothetical protein LBU15_00810 [Rickettsiales bacterium]|jgi:hypothetical protein|nr:hypothetical protein [Rickettsiales bacterium]